MQKEKKAKKLIGPSQRLLDDGLIKAQYLIDRKRLDEAINGLEDLNQRFPEQPSVLAMLMDVYFSLQKMEDYEQACEGLVKLAPHDPELVLSLAGAYLINGRPAMALKQFQDFLEHWPDHPAVIDARVTEAQLIGVLQERISGWNIPMDKAIGIAEEIEQMEQHLVRGEYRCGIILGEKIIKQYPHFIPVISYLSQIYWRFGQANKAIALLENILEFESENIIALAELTHYLLLTGRIEQAKSNAERILRFPLDTFDDAIKVVEALSYFGDDLGVLNTMHKLEQGNVEILPDTRGAMLLHLAAVSYYRTGKESEARQLWEKALQFSPDFNLATGNLKDMDAKVGDRHAPWTYTIDYWIPSKVFEHLNQYIPPPSQQEKVERLKIQVQQFLKEHGELVAIAPFMLERGDAVSREFVLGLARLVEDKSHLNAVKDFALGQWGSDQMRMEAAEIAIKRGLLPSGLIPFWVDGSRKDIFLMNIEINDKYVRIHGEKVESLLRSAIEALRINNGNKAAALLLEALQIEPDKADLLNNLAMAYQLQGSKDEAHSLIKQIHARYPDYLFGRTSMAMMQIQEGSLEWAENLLEPLRWRTHMYHSEFDAFCATHIELFLAQKKDESAESWFKMWESVDPENSKLDRYRFRLGRPMPSPEERRGKSDSQTHS